MGYGPYPTRRFRRPEIDEAGRRLKAAHCGKANMNPHLTPRGQKLCGGGAAERGLETISLKEKSRFEI
ncbi:hypothetical protein EYF80_011231 [Liparis tanakae]|uniref:Uncharacterized protein n=1 Tax=Liparis tanakae TaxID=230148 RepID=A0A4Z2IL54_9TELE|nr:hypothetical protein EYF80_011231 [Liparis tanakae]